MSEISWKVLNLTVYFIHGLKWENIYEEDMYTSLEVLNMEKTMTYCVDNPDPGLGQAQK